MEENDCEPKNLNNTQLLTLIAYIPKGKFLHPEENHMLIKTRVEVLTKVWRMVGDI